MTVENWVGAVCMQFGVYFALYATYLQERKLHLTALEGWLQEAQRAKALSELAVSYQADSYRYGKQRDKLAELARRWVPNDDNGHGSTMSPGAAPTHVVDRILAER